MLTSKSVNHLHQVGALLSTKEEFDQAIQILMAHHPDTKQERLRRRAEEQARYQAMPGKDRLAYEQARIAEAHARKEKRYYEQLAAKEELRGSIADGLEKMRLSYNCRPMFFHYYENTGHVGTDKKTGEQYDILALKATSCLLIDKATKEVRSKGIAIVSDLDNPSKLEGRDLALQRALHALDDRSTKDPVNRFDAKWITKFIDKEAAYMGNWTNKIIYHPDQGQLTQLELDRLDKWQSKKAEALTA